MGLDQLRSALGPGHPLHSDDKALLRFLQYSGARWLPIEGGMDAIIELIDAHVAWRARNPQGKFSPGTAEELAKGKVFVRGVDRKGQPVIVVVPRNFDPKRRNLQDAMRAAAYVVDEALSVMDVGVEQFTLLMDRSGYMLRKHWDSRYIKQVLEMLRDHYPGRLGAMYMYPVTEMTRMSCSLAWPFMDPLQREALKLVGSEEELLSLIPAESLPKHLGGTDERPSAFGPGALTTANDASVSSRSAATARSEARSDDDDDDDDDDVMAATSLPSKTPSWRDKEEPTKSRLALRAHLEQLRESDPERQDGGAQGGKRATFVEGEAHTHRSSPLPPFPDLLLPRLPWPIAARAGFPIAARAGFPIPARLPTFPGQARDGAQRVLEQIEDMNATLLEQTEARRKAKAQLRQLIEVLDEMVTTEGNYLADLRHTCDTFLVPLKGTLEPASHAAIFSNLLQLYELHKQVDASLHASASTADSSLVDKARQIAEAFTSLLPYFKMYSTYCANYMSVGPELKAVRMHDRAGKVISAAEAQSGSMTLEALLFRPVQRMCVYPLLFKEASKCEQGGELSAEAPFAAAFEAMEAAVLSINNEVRRVAQQQRAAEVILKACPTPRYLREWEHKLRAYLSRCPVGAQRGVRRLAHGIARPADGDGRRHALRCNWIWGTKYDEHLLAAANAARGEGCHRVKQQQRGRRSGAAEATARVPVVHLCRGP